MVGRVGSSASAGFWKRTVDDVSDPHFDRKSLPCVVAYVFHLGEGGGGRLRLHVGYVRLFSNRSQMMSNMWSKQKIWKISDHYFSTFFSALLLRNRLMAK